MIRLTRNDVTYETLPEDLTPLIKQHAIKAHAPNNAKTFGNLGVP